MTLTPDQLRQALVESILDVAPEADMGTVRPDRPLRAQLDIDSFDFLRVLEGLHARTGIDVPEADYGKMETLESSLAYLATRLAGS
ncbi:MAG: acyl carrier protein [Betaproteobacteria bacterium]|nr:acyl carrier protein [Betaproteobacteria bacterium]